MKQILDLGVLGVTILMMLTVGMALEQRHFSIIWRRKRVVAGVLAAQIVFLPLLGFLLARVLSLPPHLAAGILLLAACPVGDISNLYTLLARGNVALSVSLNTLSCLLAAVSMVVVFSVYGSWLGEQFIFAVPPLLLILKLFLMVVLPVLAGMTLRHFQPGFVVRQSTAMHRVCVAGIAVLFAYLATSRWTQVRMEWRQSLVASLTFIGLALVAGSLFARLLRLNAAERATVGISFAVRHVALALTIVVTIMNQLDYAAFIVIYFLVEAPFLLAVVAVQRRRFGEVVKIQSEAAE